VNLSEVAVAAAVTVSIAGISYAAFNVDGLTGSARTVAAEASCRTVEAGIAAYVVQYETLPDTVAQLRPYVRGDISAYRIVRGRAAGPGCPVSR
jgi:hypothetical protein